VPTFVPAGPKVESRLRPNEYPLFLGVQDVTVVEKMMSVQFARPPRPPFIVVIVYSAVF